MKSIFALFIILSTLTALANSDELVLGIFRQSTTENVTTGSRTAPRPGFGLGARASFDFNPWFYSRLGFMVERRTFSEIIASVEHNPEIFTFDLQTQFGYQLGPLVSIFAGPQFSVLLSKNCKPTAGPCLISDDPEKYIVPLQFGIDFNFLNAFGAELFYELISQEHWPKTFKSAQSYGLNLTYKF